MKVTANFNGRKSGAIGIFYPIEFTFEIPELSATEEQLRLELYNRGYEHISSLKFTVIDGKLDVDIPEAELCGTIHATSGVLSQIKEHIVDEFVELGAVKVAFLRIMQRIPYTNSTEPALNYDLAYFFNEEGDEIGYASLISEKPTIFNPPRVWSQYFIDSHQFFNLRHSCNEV